MEAKNVIRSITLELAQVDKVYSITVNSFENLNDLSKIAGTLTRALYRKLELFKLHGSTPIALNRKTSFNIIVNYDGEIAPAKLINVTEKLNIHNIGRLYREYEAKFSMYLFVILSDSTKPIEVVRHDQIISVSSLPSKVAVLTPEELN